MATNTGFTNGGGALGSRHRVRYVAAAGAALAAMIYLLIGLGAVWIGQPSSGGTPGPPSAHHVEGCEEVGPHHIRPGAPGPPITCHVHDFGCCAGERRPLPKVV